MNMFNIAYLRHQQPRLVLLAFVLLFFGPLLGANYLLSHGGTWFKAKTNYGFLLQPMLSLDSLNTLSSATKTHSSLNGKWLLLYLAPQHCGDLCQANLHKMQQVRAALGKDTPRLQNALLTTTLAKSPLLNNWLHQHYPSTLLLTVRNKPLQRWIAPALGQLPPQSIDIQQGSLYLADPLGNVLLAYRPDALSRGLFKDLTRLLKVSHIG